MAKLGQDKEAEVWKRHFKNMKMQMSFQGHENVHT